MRHKLSALACALMVVALPAAAAAQATPAEALAQIREQVLYASYREARSGVEAYLERDDLDADQRNAGLETLATIHIALRQTPRAREILAQLYARDPGHRLSDPDASPPVLSAFGRARANPPEPVSVGLDDETAELDRRAPPTVRVSVREGRGAVTEIRLAYRQGGGAFTTVVMTLDGGRASARVPLLEDGAAYTMSYYVQARAPSGHVLGTLGSDVEPLDLVIPERSAVDLGGGGGATIDGGGDDGAGIAVALIVALLVLGGGVTAGILIAGELGGPQDGSLGNIELPLVRF